MTQEQYVTKEGLKALEEELQQLKTIRRREIADAITAAKEQGDLSENAEYQQAKDEQRRMEEKISELEVTVKRAQVIGKSSTEQVDIGNIVTIECDGAQKEYRIVGSNEANPLEGKISNESPIGRALLGKKKGESASIPTPVGDKECSIVDIKNA